MATSGMWLELDGPLRLRGRPVRLWRIAILAFGLSLLIASAMLNQKRLIAGQQAEIHRLQEYVRHLEERLGILNQIRSHRPTLPHEEATALAHAIQWEARRYNLDWRLLLAIIRVESRFDPRARSPRGAIGLMQVRPAAFAEVVTELGWTNRYPEELADLRVNVRVGTHYLFRMVRRFGDLERAVQAYYLGPSRVANPSEQWKRLGRQYLETLRIRQASPWAWPRRAEKVHCVPCSTGERVGGFPHATASHPRRGRQPFQSGVP